MKIFTAARMVRNEISDVLKRSSLIVQNCLGKVVGFAKLERLC